MLFRSPVLSPGLIDRARLWEKPWRFGQAERLGGLEVGVVMPALKSIGTACRPVEVSDPPGLEVGQEPTGGLERSDHGAEQSSEAALNPEG